MLFLILAIVVALVSWALRLMDQALKVQEFSLRASRFLSGLLRSGPGRGLFFDE
jgi:hypothetical protein